MGTLFPSTTGCQEVPQVYGEAEPYIDMLTHPHTKQVCPHGNSIEEFGQAHQKCVKSQYGSDLQRTATYNVHTQQHEPTCIRFNNRRIGNKKRLGLIFFIYCSRFILLIKYNYRKSNGVETSITSVHSSGQDSGIAESGRCPCGQSTTQSSEDSSKLV